MDDSASTPLPCDDTKLSGLSALNALRMPIARSWISLLIVIVCVQSGVNDPTHSDDEGLAIAAINRVGRSFRHFSVYHQKTPNRNILGTFFTES